MPTDSPDPPARDEVEVSLFGPGFGECVVLHLGANRWIIVDSCLDKESQQAAALAYFEQIGVEPAKSVDLVVCTHWHDQRILSHTPYAYATSPSRSPRKRISQPAEKLFRRKGIKLRALPASQGHLRLRKNLHSPSPWNIALFGRAHQLQAVQ